MLLAVALSCSATQPIQPRIVHNVHKNDAILIAAVSSDFKNKLIDRLIDDYKSRADIRLVNLEDLEGIDLSFYDALVVLDARTGWMMFNVKVKRLIRGMDDRGKLVLVLTARKTKWEWKKNDVDAITCASIKDHFYPVYRRMTKKLDKILRGP